MDSNNKQFKNKNVLIFGLGLNDGGLGMAEYFIRKGAKITITDGKTEQELLPTLEKLKKYTGKFVLHMGGHIEADFIDNDIIIRNPAIKPNNKYLQIAKNAKKLIYMEMVLFHKFANGLKIGITGTKGKSTTTTLIYKLLKQKYDKRVFLGGNIGKSAVKFMDKLQEDSISVLELSSFQLDNMGENNISPNIAVITNIHTDHLDWHGTREDYIKAKENIFKYQSSKDYAILNYDDPMCKDISRRAKANLITFSIHDVQATYFIDKHLNIFERGKKIFTLKSIKLQGEHNKSNIICAIATTKVLKVSNKDICKIIESFKGIEGRQEFVRKINNVRFYNDTTATNVEALKSMLDTFSLVYSKKIILIFGGVDKGLDYTRVIKDIEDHVKYVVLLEGTASDKLRTLLSNNIKTSRKFSDFKQAITHAYNNSNSGDIVVLSPAAASFNMFKNEFDRGKQFKSIVKSL